ncbi:aldehyde dehydrogenase family protein [Boseongicola aestuarii]|uniref:Aldehyde dehydrogenase B n=1 Tax=Boseongicola aestuarii TaxID=1470561 RepID=A0A238IZ94_9RHOB|nr:aldehyde dehydrogenase family protein [Boseongicola aestuarii]SMX23361.1 Aldehyde dehydrogenase B [Boseongicola aestuarii]
MTVLEAFKSMDYGLAPESDAEALAWIAGRNAKFGHFINGEFTEPRKLFQTCNPATAKVLAQVSAGAKKDVDAAVEAANAAQPSWEAMGGSARSRYLYALARLVQKNSRLLSVLETLDNGKSIRETRDIDIPLVARHFYYHAGWARLLKSEFPGYEAAGVAGQIIPWNFPLLMLAWKVAPALAAGNTVVLKPAEYTPLTSLCFAEICQQAGLPKGVVNIVTGAGDTGALVAGHKKIDKVAFTGSSTVGRIIRQQTAGKGKKLTLELGGKSPFIVFEDADIDGAVEGLVDAIWFNQGQVCCAGSRLLMQESIAEQMLQKIKVRMDKLRVGNPMDKSIDMGAIVDPVQKQRIAELVDVGVKEGAEIYQCAASLPTDGCYYPPTLLSSVEPAMRVAQEEIFGPVLVAMTFRTPAEAVELANNTRYGLAASVWTENINLSLDIAPQVKAGIVWINSTNLFDAAAGFGGYRESGYGREGGREGMFEYLKPSFLKTLTAAKPSKTSAFTKVSAPNSVDRTRKLYVGGKQARPDGGYDRAVLDPSGKTVGQVGEGNRKDIRNAVEAASNAKSWATTTGHARAQILYYIAENLSARASEFAATLKSMTGDSHTKEVDTSIDRLFCYGAWADKFDGAVHQVPIRGVALAMNEPIGVIGIACPNEAPLLSFISLVAPAIALGNRVVALPSQDHPLAATDFYQVLETSDLPGGVLNIVTGDQDLLTKTLSEHAGVDALWHFGSANSAEAVELASIINLKQTWVAGGKARNWFDEAQSEGREFLRHASQVKNIWVPYGE